MAEQRDSTDSLNKIPENIGLSYLPNSHKVSQKNLEKAVNIFTQGYIHEIKVYEGFTKVNVSCKCYPSMRKTQNPHKINIEINIDAEKITDAYCSCKAG